MWIIQEVTLAKEVAIHCGIRTLSWQKLVQMYKDLQTVISRGREIHTPSAHAIHDNPAMSIVRTKAELGGSPRPLRLLLQDYGNHEATKIRDKIYALVGIAENASDIVIDYHMSVKEVLLDVFYHEQNRLGVGAKARHELTQFAKEVQTILKVPLSEAEINFHIAHAP
jgi:hypothetical protein